MVFYTRQLCTNTYSVEVELEEGTLIGYQTTGKHFEVFKQVPYAKSPEGNLRFRKPEPIGTFAGGIHDSVAVGDNLKACIGTGVGSNDLQDALDMGFISEDCLTMDIYRPVKNYHTRLPIFVWIHGGGLTSGTSAYYHFSRLAREDIIVAVVQYRLGVHGFLSSYSAEGLTETPGNFGLLDQQAAIEKITIGGESAGGWSVGWHMLSTKSTNMIRTAISQSGMASFDMSPQDSEHGNLAIKHLCEKTKAKINSTLACSGSSEDILNRFRTLTKNEIIQLEIADRESRKEFENYPEWAPVHYDGEFFKMNAKEEFEGGHIVDDVTYVIGSNSFEGSLIWKWLLRDVKTYDKAFENSLNKTKF
ncbi:Oidioi.mRNA.OKI2018_I69.XSR.g16590.t1.cds [Oikopleura dioica]|uniref:Oidioi.mRNA.OKI2018_I69.XSR.g16590.t1.cds n=1 Tax=Oikopleura dioica TaxID=34765 RepID=A0ABN7SIF9_OIKDI|nr:Oidioi.mRNA.OKI2018_I69.XSR.g16590.t1.cds [Oikopleura dioica]